MKSFQHRIEIDAPAERVWQLTVDIEAWPSLFPTVTAVERLSEGPLRVGSTARLTQPAQPPRVWTVTELDAPRRYVWTAVGRGFTMRAMHEIEPLGPARAANTLTIEVGGPLAGVLAALAGRKLRQVLATENEGFRSAAEVAPVG